MDRISALVENRVESMLANADKPSERIIQSERWREWFGVMTAIRFYNEHGGYRDGFDSRRKDAGRKIPPEGEAVILEE